MSSLSSSHSGLVPTIPSAIIGPSMGDDRADRVVAKIRPPKRRGFFRGLAAAGARWFDSYHGTEGVAISQEQKVDWVRILPFLAVHVACLSVFFVGWSPVAVGVAVGLYAIRMFAITGFYHRYFSHRTFKTSRFWQFMFALLGSAAAQRGPLWWAAHHRDHHRHSDQEDDVHSPHVHGFWWAHVGWITSKSNFVTKLRAVPDLRKFKELVFLDRFDNVVPIALGVSIFLLGVVLNSVAPSLGTSGLQMLVWGFLISTVFCWHGTFTINSLAHLMGRKRYKIDDESRNSLFLALITFGEGWHNNHHYYPAATRQGFYWWEIDITYYILRGLALMGIIWDLNPVPGKVRERQKLAA